jgi:hypothetical protein
MSTISENQVGLFILLGAFIVGLSMVRVSFAGVEKRVGALWRIEAKIDLLLKQAGVEFNPFGILPQAVVEALARGEKIQAIKCYREATGAGLKESKDVIEEAQRRAGVGG